MYELQPNTLLQCGKYRIKRFLGQGTFGITYLATMQVIGEGCDMEIDVAVKEFFMNDTNSRNGEDSSVTGSQSELFKKYRSKFLTEAKNLEKMSKYGDIVKIYDVFEENNTAYFSMEYVDGLNLDDYIKQRGRLSESEAIECIKSIASALKHLHDNKMLHLDLKPKNIMRRNDGKLYLIDFGLSKQFDDKGEPESSTSIGLGTPGYAPIEQANFKGVFAPTLDIYALGATFYKMLTGVTAPVSSDIVDTGFTPLKTKLLDVGASTPTRDVIEKAMRVKKTERFQTIDAFLKAFDTDNTTVVSKKDTTVVVENLSPKKRQNKAKRIIKTILGVILGIVAIWWIHGYISAKLDERKYNTLIGVIEDVIDNYKYNNLPPETLKEFNKKKSSWFLDLDRLYNEHHTFMKSVYCYDSWHYRDDFKKAYYEWLDKNPPIIIKDIKFCNKTKDNKVIDDYGSTLYKSQIKYLYPKLKIISLRDDKKITLYYKVYMDGVLSSNSKTSPFGYTAADDVTLYDNTTEVSLSGWGNDEGTAYQNVSYVRWEVWYNGQKIGEKTINLH